MLVWRAAVPPGQLRLAMLAHFLGNYGMTWPLVILKVIQG